MDEVTFGNLMKHICQGIGVFGVLIGLDLSFGAKVITGLKQVLDKSTYIIDQAMTGKSKKLSGVVILVLSVLMLFAVSLVK